MWFILDINGKELASFNTDVEAFEATYSGEYPDDCEVAYIN